MPLPDDQTVRSSTQLWSETVAIANADDPLACLKREPAYEFTGRTFYEPERTA